MFLITNSKVYDTLKYIAQVALPAFGALYFALSQVWGLSNGEQVAGSVLAVDTFLGVLLRLSNNAYKESDDQYDGTVDVTETDSKKSFLLNINDDPDKLDQKDSITLKVNKVKPMKQKVTRARKSSKGKVAE